MTHRQRTLMTAKLARMVVYTVHSVFLFVYIRRTPQVLAYGIIVCMLIRFLYARWHHWSRNLAWNKYIYLIFEDLYIFSFDWDKMRSSAHTKIEYFTDSMKKRKIIEKRRRNKMIIRSFPTSYWIYVSVYVCMIQTEHSEMIASANVNINNPLESHGKPKHTKILLIDIICI